MHFRAHLEFVVGVSNLFWLAVAPRVVYAAAATLRRFRFDGTNPLVITSLRQGEVGFFDTLKPPGAKILEEAFDTRAIRQGDWFAVPLPSWNVARGMMSFAGPDDPPSRLYELYEPKNEKERKVQLRETRHTLIADRYRNVYFNKFGCVLVGEGLLKAPDHADRVLKGPHAFFQTINLVDPKNAD